MLTHFIAKLFFLYFFAQLERKYHCIKRTNMWNNSSLWVHIYALVTKKQQCETLKWAVIYIHMYYFDTNKQLWDNMSSSSDNGKVKLQKEVIISNICPWSLVWRESKIEFKKQLRYWDRLWYHWNVFRWSCALNLSVATARYSWCCIRGLHQKTQTTPRMQRDGNIFSLEGATKSLCSVLTNSLLFCVKITRCVAGRQTCHMFQQHSWLYSLPPTLISRCHRRNTGTSKCLSSWQQCSNPW